MSIEVEAQLSVRRMVLRMNSSNMQISLKGIASGAIAPIFMSHASPRCYTRFDFQPDVLTRRRRRWFGEFLAPFRVFPNSFLPVLRWVQRDSSGNLDHGYCAQGRKSSPEPIFALTRLMIGSSRIGTRSNQSFSLPGISFLGEVAVQSPCQCHRLPHCAQFAAI